MLPRIHSVGESAVSVLQHSHQLAHSPTALDLPLLVMTARSSPLVKKWAIAHAVFRNIEGSAVGTPSELDIKGLFDDMDVNSNKIGGTVTKRNELIVKLLESVGDLQSTLRSRFFGYSL